ncbi:MAG: DUF72 domain-containing protein [bacterium]|nr:DUF72 domain-containing protein [bacterium]
MKWFIGTSGWSYEHWRGIFYPDDLKSKDWLSFYTQHFSTVEVNSTFYHMPNPATLDNWRKNTPDNFVFTLKMNRWVTHRKKLEDVGYPLNQFCGTARRLEHKLGCILHQIPPSMTKDIPLLASYLTLLPKEVRHAIEFRHESWSDEETFDLLHSEGVAYCIISAPKLEAHIRATAPFAYIRMHGQGGWYASRYSDNDLKEWAGSIVKLARQGCYGYVYFNNDYGGYAVENALTLRKQLDHPSRRHVLTAV